MWATCEDARAQRAKPRTCCVGQPSLRRYLAAKYDGLCAMCGADIVRLDHIFRTISRMHNWTRSPFDLQWRKSRWAMASPHPFPTLRNTVWDVDHITPVHLGGAILHASNLQPLCMWCHKTKTGAEASARLKGKSLTESEKQRRKATMLARRRARESARG